MKKAIPHLESALRWYTVANSGPQLYRWLRKDSVVKQIAAEWTEEEIAETIVDLMTGMLTIDQDGFNRDEISLFVFVVALSFKAFPKYLWLLDMIGPDQLYWNTWVTQMKVLMMRQSNRFLSLP